MISRTKDKRPNITKDAPIAFTAQEIPRVWGAVSQEPWIEGVFTNHNITVPYDYGTTIISLDYLPRLFM